MSSWHYEFHVIHPATSKDKCEASGRASERKWQTKNMKRIRRFQRMLEHWPSDIFLCGNCLCFFLRGCAQYEKCNEPPNKKDNNSTYERVKQVENE